MSEAYTVMALSPMRKIIVARTTEATRTLPHFRLSADIEADAFLDLRKELHGIDPDSNVSLNDLLIKACAAALMDTPSSIPTGGGRDPWIPHGRHFSRAVQDDLGDFLRSESTDRADSEK